jgi:hypothetical protein
MIIGTAQRFHTRYPHITIDPDLIVICDECCHEFMIYRCKLQAKKNKYHFCSKKCSQYSLSYGKIRLDIQEKLINDGYSNITQRPDIRQKIEETNLKKFGFKSNLSSQDTKQKRIATFLKKYGVDNAAKSDIVKDKARESWSLKSENEKKEITSKQKVANHSKSEEERSEIRQKIKATLTERYGVTCPFQLQSSKVKANSPEACKKRFDTMRKNESFRKSKPEEVLYHLLCERFGEESVMRQVTLHNTRWPIDFYIKTIDTYVQYDGVYWHGHGRALEEVAEHKTSRDVMIHSKMLTDMKQDKWFISQGLTLVRISGKHIQDVCNHMIDDICKNAICHKA